MKIHLVLILSILGGEWAHGTVQTSLNQDKPPYLILNFNFSQNGSYSLSNYKQYVFNVNNCNCGTWFDESYTIQWNDNMGGSIGNNSANGGGSWLYQNTFANGYSDGFNYWWSWSNPNYTIQTYLAWNSSGQGQPTVSTNSGIDYVFEACWDSYFYTNASFRYPTEDTNDDWYTANWTLEENDTAHATVTLQTGGKATSKLRNLISLNVSEVWSMIPDVYDDECGYDFCYWIGGPSIPTQNISVGGFGPINPDNTKYMSLPDNATVDVTPQVTGVAGLSGYTFYVNQPQKYHSYLNLYVQQANPGYSFYPVGDVYDVGHAFWRFTTEAPNNALQYISASLTNLLGHSWGFYPNGTPAASNLWTTPGELEKDDGHSYNIHRKYYIGFSPDLLNGLEFTRGISNAPPEWSATGYNCVSAARNAAYFAGVHALPWDMTPQNFGVMLVEMYSGPFNDTNDIFYSPY
jgi:hypothetical protein